MSFEKISDSEVINEKEGQWGPFSPGIIVLSSIVQMNKLFLEGKMSMESLEELLYNPRTCSNLEKVGCPKIVLDLFEQGLVFIDIHNDDPELAVKSVQRVSRESIELLLKSIKDFEKRY